MRYTTRVTFKNYCDLKLLLLPLALVACKGELIGSSADLGDSGGLGDDPASGNQCSIGDTVGEVTAEDLDVSLSFEEGTYDSLINVPSSSSYLPNVQIFGVLGTMTLGANVTGANASLSANIPAGYYDGSKTCTMADANLIAANIKSGSTIFGVAGSYSASGSFGSFMASGMHRNTATAQMTQATETSTSTYASGYRDIPDILLDDENRDSTLGPAPDKVCGVVSTTVAGKITDCQTRNGAESSWVGGTDGNSSEGNWTLVTLTSTATGALEGDTCSGGSASGCYEVWRDERTGLLWSDTMPTTMNWCRAAGSIQADDPSNYCNNATYQDQTTPYSACAEAAGIQSAVSGENWASSTYHAAKGYMGKTATPVVRWRLPTRNDYMVANVNGLLQVLPSLANSWTATVYSSIRGRAYVAIDGGLWIAATTSVSGANATRTTSLSVRCVGR